MPTLPRKSKEFPSFLYLIAILVFLFVAAIFIFVGYVAVSAVIEITDHGLRNVIQDLWCGPDVSCLFPPDVPIPVEK